MKYEIKGAPMPVAICYLQDGETMIAERGSMSWMSPNMEMETHAGGIGKAFGRLISGESMFRNTYRSRGGEGLIAFASSFPGSIVAFQIEPGREMIVQKFSFLASESTVDLSVYLQKKVGAGFFGGEGFIMQRLSGYGTAFVEFDGSVMEYELAAGQSIVVDTGYLAAMEGTCSMEIRQVPGLKNKLLGGEGFFNTVVHGPGKVWIQTMSVNKVADVLRPYFPIERD